MEQLVLPLASNIYNPQEFIISNSNFVVYNRVINYKTTWGVPPFENILLIYGPVSSGKTYIANICKQLYGAFIINNDNINILDDEIFLENKIFVIDNIENYKEINLLHNFNRINEQGKYLLLTTGKFNNNFQLNDLSSRINSVLKLEIKQPDDELMRTLLFKYFSDNFMQTTDIVVDFLLRHIPRQFEQIKISLQLINNFAMTHKKKVTISMIKQILKI